jgi:hypothetical protein
MGWWALVCCGVSVHCVLEYLLLDYMGRDCRTGERRVGRDRKRGTYRTRGAGYWAGCWRRNWAGAWSPGPTDVTAAAHPAHSCHSASPLLTLTRSQPASHSKCRTQLPAQMVSSCAARWDGSTTALAGSKKSALAGEHWAIKALYSLSETGTGQSPRPVPQQSFPAALRLSDPVTPI